MMPDSYLAFVVATLLLALIPGPNVTAIIGTSLAYGVGRGVIVAAGASAALAVQLVVVVAGLAPLLMAVGWFGEVLRWLGVGYLFYLAFREWRSAAAGSLVSAPPPKAARAFGRGVLVAAVNPKTIAFLAAFLPQFVAPERPALTQLAVLGATFLAVLFAVDAGYAIGAGSLRRHFASPRAALWRGRLAGLFLFGTGAWLALSRR